MNNTKYLKKEKKKKNTINAYYKISVSSIYPSNTTTMRRALIPRQLMGKIHNEKFE